MKSFKVALFCLLCTVVWAEDEITQPNEDADAQAVSIRIFTYEDDTYGLGIYDKVNWHQAELLCASKSSTLVSITSEVVFNRIKEWIRTMASDDLPTIANEPIWTSGTNLGVSSQYVWQGTGSAIYYNNFRDTPNSYSSCVGFNAVTGFWSDHDCREPHYFMCQKYTSDC